MSKAPVAGFCFPGLLVSFAFSDILKASRFSMGMCEGGLGRSQMLKIRIKKNYPTNKNKCFLSLTTVLSLGWLMYLALSVVGERSDIIFSPLSVNRIYLAHCGLPQEKFKIPN